MAQINSKDLGQILIKETTADTNDVFNVLISQGAKGGFAVAAQLINVLNISIPFHHVPASLNSPSLPLVLSLRLPRPSSKRLFRTVGGSPQPLPHPCKVNLKVCKVVLLCVFASCGHCVLNRGKNQRWCQEQQQDSGIECMKINCLSQQRNSLFSITRRFENSYPPFFSMCRLMMSNH